MSGVGFFELVILFMIGLVVLGPKRLPKVANQLGTWIGQARRMTRVMKRQLEEELDLSEDFKDLKNIKDDLVDDLTIGPAAAHIPRDDDNYSPLHDETPPDGGREASVSTEADKPTEDLAEGTLLSHLIELRTRLVRMFIAVIVVFIVLVPFANQIFEIAAQPIVSVVPGGQLISVQPAAPLLTPLKLTFFAALFIAMPVVLYQVWAFVAPGLYRKEKHFAFPLLASSILLFYAGIAFAYFVVFDLVFGFFVSVTPDIVQNQPDISAFLDFIIKIFLAFGIAFEVPIATVLIVWTGLTTPKKLTKVRPYVFLMAFVLGMFLTPPDVISQTLLAVPVYLLYELGIIMSRLFTTKRKKDDEEAVATDS
jgi:sec-independent protein translocase protein TatC